ncbi:hypothetical protein EVAR_61475_1 [Eumeta japonica]|uniref:Uncharacterized protein n=1 Tax=Eumeta variegata TaxID=151549 RepID=A0A4C1Z6B7_EUMVA|nr:hypothetical protein EVAR_61475_1 [Eumeta japonica]
MKGRERQLRFLGWVGSRVRSGLGSKQCRIGIGIKSVTCVEITNNTGSQVENENEIGLTASGRAFPVLSRPDGSRGSGIKINSGAATRLAGYSAPYPSTSGVICFFAAAWIMTTGYVGFDYKGVTTIVYGNRKVKRFALKKSDGI